MLYRNSALSTQPLATTCIRMAVATDIFEILKPDRAINFEEVVIEIGAKAELLIRV